MQKKAPVPNKPSKFSVKRPTIIERKKLKGAGSLRTLLKSTKRYYEAFADGYVEFYKSWVKGEEMFSDADYKEGYDRVARILTDIVKPEERLIDIGCGVGVWSTLMAKNGAYVTSLDYAENALKRCKERAREFGVESRIKTVLADGFHLPFQGESFDGATLNWVLAHIPVSRNVEFLKEVSRVVKDNGWLVVSDSYWRGQKGGKEQIQARETDEGSCEIYKYYYEPEEFQALIEKTFGDIHHFETTSYEMICMARKRAFNEQRR